jgi:hypothetical protein
MRMAVVTSVCAPGERGRERRLEIGEECGERCLQKRGRGSKK